MMLRSMAALAAVLSYLLLIAQPARASERGAEVTAKLQGFDAYMEQLLVDWNGVGFGVGIVVDDELVFARGYGYRDYGKKLPLTPQTLFPIASNTKLFAAVSAGLLVDAGQLSWDGPVRSDVPTIKFFNDELDRNVTLRDMLAHRTGITRHDMIWFKSELDSAELFARLRYMEPSVPLRQMFLYNNMMYAAVANIVALKSGRPWQQYVKENILAPLDMRSTVFSIAEMKTFPEYAVPFGLREDSRELHELPFYENTRGLAAAGAMVSNISDLSHWLIALMNDGRYAGRQVLPAAALKATLQPAIAIPNDSYENRGWRELLNSEQGMGRRMASYRGHSITYHGGDLAGFHSQISYMPAQRIGVVVVAIGDHTAELYDPISFNVYERALGLDLTPWSERLLALEKKSQQADKAAREQIGNDRMRGTKPSHPLKDYVGEYEHPAYGTLRITLADRALQLDFHRLNTRLNHYHYDRFDTSFNKEYGTYSVRFSTNPQGEMDGLTMALDEAEATFRRSPENFQPDSLAKLVGTYVTETGVEIRAVLQSGGTLVLQQVGRTPVSLLPYRGLEFRVAHSVDVVYKFSERNGQITTLYRSDPEGVRTWRRQ